MKSALKLPNGLTTRCKDGGKDLNFNNAIFTEIMPVEKKSHKSFRVSFALTLLIIFLLISGYYLSINTLLREVALPNIKINGVDVSFLSREKINAVVSDEVNNSMPDQLEVKVNDYYFFVSVEELAPRVNTDEALSFGKGSDLAKSLVESLALIRGKNFELFVGSNTEAILKNLPYNISKENYAYVEGDTVVNCKTNQFNLQINYEKLQRDVSRALLNNKALVITTERLFNNKDEAKIIDYCQIYQKDSKYLMDLLLTLTGEKEYDIDQIFTVKLKDGTSYWGVRDDKILAQILADYSIKSEVKLDEGKYEVIGDKIYLLEPYVTGKKLDVGKTLEVLSSWLKNPSESPSLQFNEILPEVTKQGKEILDFTKLLATGSTRVHLVWDNGANNIFYAQEGFDELHNTVIEAGGEFSFYNHISPQWNGTMKSGRLIGAGICTSATTLFRSALESGFPITERFNHGYNWSKYIWPYPFGIVDATYLTNPKLDVRFINDLSYPVLLRYEKTYDSENYQYNWLRVYTSSKAPNRSVTLSGWSIWNYTDFTHFEGSFVRTVNDNGNVVRQDAFYSRYDGSGRIS